MYCTAHKDTFGDLNLIDGEWPINRTHAESKRILESLKLIKKKADRLEAAKGYVVEPVIDFVEFIKIIYDCNFDLYSRSNGLYLVHLNLTNIIEQLND